MAALAQALSSAVARPFRASQQCPRRVAAKPRVVAVRARSMQDDRLQRRAAVGLLTLLPAAVIAFSADARDVMEAKRAKAARKQQLDKAAVDMRKSGKSESVFDDSAYAVSEDKSPNIHTRQEEGVRTSR